MILGRSGSGKSTSLRNFRRDEVGVFAVAGKRMPFKSSGENALQVAYNVGYDAINKAIARNTRRAYVIDDATYLMAFDNFSRAKEAGYDKFVTMAVSFENLLKTASSGTDDDTITYFLMHPEFSESGREKPRTIGKMLDQQLCVEGMFPIVIDCETRMGDDGRPRHVFVTQNDGYNLAKTPIGMFAHDEMDNDLKAVDTAIREYWGMRPITDGKTDNKEKANG